MPEHEQSGLAALDLPDIPAMAWHLLQAGAAQGRAAFHTPVVATAGPAGPAARTVVLRHVNAEARTLAFHTDARSPKLDELHQGASLSWVFYDREAKLQLRVRGSTELHQGDALAEARWAASRDSSRLCYRNPEAPGAPVDSPEVAWPPADGSGFDNFLVVESRIDVMDWLFLSAHGHRRAAFRWSAGAWQGQWVAP